MRPAEARQGLLLCFSLFAAWALFSQEARFSRLSREDGLSNSSVSSIVQDSRGFLWFGTKNGLNRYDGYEFIVYSNNPFEDNSLSHNLVQTIFMDTEDVLWVGTYRGLNRFDTRTKRFTRYTHDPNDPESLSNDIVTAVSRDSEGRLWAGTLDGLNALDERTGAFRRYRNAAEGQGPLPKDTVRSLLCSKDGELWVGTYGGLLRYDAASDSFSVFRSTKTDRPDERLPSDNVMVLSEDSAGRLWAGCWGGGLVRIDADRRGTSVWSFSDNRLYSLVVGYSGVVYAGTWGGGLIELNLATGTHVVHRADSRHPYFLSNDVVYSLFKDESGLLWIGTNGGGVHWLDRTRDRFDLFANDPQVPSSLSKGAVLAVLEDSRGRLWVGSYNGGLNRLDPGSSSFIHYRHDPKSRASLSNDIVNGLMEDGSGTVWVATNEGLCRFDEASDSFERYDGPDPTYYALTKDSAGRHWYGYFRKGAERWDPSTGERLRFEYDPQNRSSLSDNLVYFVKEDSRGRVWLGTNSGLNRYAPETGGFVRYKHDASDRSSLPSDTLRCMLEDSKGRLWFGTAPGGLSLLDLQTGKFTHFTKRDGLPDDNVVSILEDSGGLLWLGTNYGLCVFNPETRNVTVLDVRDGLQGLEFSIGHFRNAKGELFFGGVDGLNRIKNAALRRNAHVPPVKLTSFKVFDKALAVGLEIADLREVRLSRKENFVSIEFSALDFTDPKSNRYAYMLEGFDKGWINAGARRYASYTNLPGGNYVFRVKASNNNGVWNEEGASLRIQVKPGFWATPAAFILYFAGSFFLFAGIAGWASREQRLRLSVAELAERRRIGAELKDAKERAEAADKAKSEFLANLSHEIRTPMNAVLGYASILSEKMVDDPRRSLVEVIDRSGRSLLALLNDALDLSRIDAGKTIRRRAPLRIWTLVSDLTEMFRLRIDEKGLSLRAVVDPAIPQVILCDESKLRQILVNLIGNAIKFTERGEVSVGLSSEGEPPSLVIRVEDTGIGLSEAALKRVFEPFYQDEFVGERYGGTGLGLTIVKRLAEELGGSVSVDSRVGAGSRFTVVVPGLCAPVPEAGSLDSISDNRPDDRRLDGLDLLIVEDDPVNRDILSRFLESRGATVRTAEDGEKGLNAMSLGIPDAVLADLRMPKIDGFEFMRRIRANPETAGVPILIVTADVRAQTRVLLAAFSATSVVPKPVDRSQLFDCLESALPGRITRTTDVPEFAPAAELSYESLLLELGSEKAEKAVSELAGTALAARRSISAALIVDEWDAFVSAVEAVFVRFGSRELGLYASRTRAALSAFDVEQLAGLRAEFDSLFRDGSSS